MTEQDSAFAKALAESGQYDCFPEGFNSGWLSRASRDHSVGLALLVLTTDPTEQAAARQQAIELARQILKEAE